FISQNPYLRMQVGVLSLWAKKLDLLESLWEQAARWRAPASPVFAGKPAPTTACVHPPMCVHHHLCRRGFTREYGGGGNGERQVGIGQQGRPLRG
ncbi:hypothetical protein RDI61_29025, partial [Pseudomonas plecoglossicida]|uniref:hypothetical protein n=1 Tax=Pseudomonas putida group TaxID=136845 RepID=UPI0028083A72